MTPSDELDRKPNEYIAKVLGTIHRAEDAGFIPVASETELQAKAPQAYWASNHSLGPQPQGLVPLFRPDTSPWAAPAKRSYHVGGDDTWDFLRHEYTIGDMNIVVVDGVNEVVVRLLGLGGCLLAIAPEAQLADIERLAALLFVAPWNGQPHADFPAVAWERRSPWMENGGAAFTTSRVMDPFVTMAAWMRLDAGVWRNDIYFLHYKAQNAQMLGRGQDPRSWFGGAER